MKANKTIKVNVNWVLVLRLSPKQSSLKPENGVKPYYSNMYLNDLPLFKSSKYCYNCGSTDATEIWKVNVTVYIIEHTYHGRGIIWSTFRKYFIENNRFFYTLRLVTIFINLNMNSSQKPTNDKIVLEMRGEIG